MLHMAVNYMGLGKHKAVFRRCANVWATSARSSSMAGSGICNLADVPAQLVQERFRTVQSYVSLSHRGGRVRLCNRNE
jgi:hypothetical protein